MSHFAYSEYLPTDDEIEEELREIYPDPVDVCGMEMDQVRVLKEMDRLAFDIYASDNMRWYICDACQKVFRGDDAEEEARECCQEYCNVCGEAISSGDLCEECQRIEDGYESEE